MTHPNADRIRAGYEAMARGDGRVLADYFAADTVWHLMGSGPLAGDYVGRDAVFGLLKRVAVETDRSFHVESTHVLADDRYALALTRSSGRRAGNAYSGSGISVYRLDPEGRVVEAWLLQEDREAYDRFWRA